MNSSSIIIGPKIPNKPSSYDSANKYDFTGSPPISAIYDNESVGIGMSIKTKTIDFTKKTITHIHKCRIE